MLYSALFLIILTSLMVSSKKDSCESYNYREYWRMCGACGLCQHVQVQNEQSWLCDYEYFKQIFVPESKSKCQIVNRCQKAPDKDDCKDNKCVPMLGTLKCQCSTKKEIGRLCQYSVAQGMTVNDYAVVVNILYTPFFTLNEYLTISLLFSSLGKNIIIEIETLLEKLRYDSEECSEMDSSRIISYCEKFYPHKMQYCTSNIFQYKNVKRVFTAKIPFPGRSFIRKDREYVRWGKIPEEKDYFLGNVEKVKLAVYNNNDQNPVFEANFSAVDIVLSPSFTYCEPFTILKEGGETLFEAIKIPRRRGLQIDALYKMPKEDKECISGINDLKIDWRIWKFEINHKEKGEKWYQESVDVEFIDIKRFSIEPGMYKVRTNVTIWFQLREGFTTSYTYFEIVLLELEPIIQGGNSKSIYYNNYEVIINGSMSRNPNLSFLEQAGDLIFHWECDKKVTNKKNQLDINYQTYYGPFKINEVYTFKLTIRSKKYNIFNTAVQKITMVQNPSPTLDIICRKNCGVSNFRSNPAESIYLEVLIVCIPLEVKSNDQFHWTYKDEKETDFKSVENIALPNTPSNVVILLANTLSEGKTYIFQVKGGSKIPGEATFQIEMASKFEISCNMQYKKVWKGDFENKVTCDRILFDNLSPTYEYYDRFPDSNEKGRLLMSKKNNKLDYVAFTRGNLVVEVTNHYGITAATEIKLNMQPLKRPDKVVNDLLNEVSFYHSTFDPETVAIIVSSIIDIIYYEKAKFPKASDIIGSLLAIVYNKDYYSFTVMKVWANTMEVLATEGEYIKLKPESLIHLSMIAVKLSQTLERSFTTSPNVFNEFRTAETFQVIKSLVNIFEKIYNSKSSELEDSSGKVENFYKLYSSYRESSENNFLAITLTMSAIVKRTLPFMPPFIMRGEEKHIDIWVKGDTPNFFYNLSSNRILNESIPSVIISRPLTNFLNSLSNFKPIIVQVVIYDGNPYWWHKTVINTNVVDLKLVMKRSEGLNYITELKFPIQINLDYQEHETKIINRSVKLNASVGFTDLDVDIHRIRVEERGRLKLKFLNLKEGEIIKVLAWPNVRPYCEAVMEDGQNITKASPEYDTEIEDPNSEDVYDLYYLGILPGHHVPIGQYMNYSFEISIMRCVSWYPKGWISRGCTVKDILPESKQLQCECEHLSSFAGYTGVPINTINPFKDYKLLVNVIDNPFVAIFIVCLLIIYFILLFYTVRKDRKDNYKQCAIFLEDNLPYDRYPYLVGVYTGTRLFAGTSSNVGITIEGEKSVSRPHILRSTKFKALERADDDWFIIFTPFHLGELKLIHIWTDYSGWRPEWYCNKIVAIDLIHKKDYTFMINSWFSLRWDDYIERFVMMETLQEKYQEDLASDNLIYGFREAHLWISVVSKHPRSGVNSSQRLSLAFCGLFAAMLVSCMFYKVLDEQQEDYPEYSIAEKEIIISIYSMIISAFITNSVTSVFRKQLVIFKPDNNDDEEEEEEVLKNNKKVTKNEGGIFIRTIQTVLKALVAKKKFVPVHLEIDVLKTLKKRPLTTICFEIFAWVVCITLIVFCGFLVILYGLKFGKIKSLEWLTSNIMSIAEEIILVSPMKIITLAVLTGILFSKIYEVVKYDLNWNLILKYKKHVINTNPDLLNKLVSLRSKSIYIPLNHRKVSRKQEKQLKKDAFWLLVDILIIGTLTILLIVQSGTLWTTRYYWNNFQLNSLLKKGYKEEGFQLNEIKNITDYLPFLEKEIIPRIYQVKWYNGSPIKNETDLSEFPLMFSFSLTSTLLGLPRVRQRRQKPGLCRTNSFSGLPQICPSRLTKDTEDDDLYSEGWKSYGGYEKFVKSSAWNYKEPSETYNIVTFGYNSLMYDSGGYIVDLESSQAASEDVITYLKLDNWIDKRTSMVIFEMSLYNPNTGTLSMLISVTERLYIGMLMNRLYVYTVKQDYDFPAIDFILLASLCTFIIRVTLAFSRRGIENTIVNFWNLFEIAIVCLSIYCAFLYIKHIKNMKGHLKEYSERDEEQYFHFLNLISDLTYIQVIMIALVIMIACRFMKSWRFGNIFNIFFYTLLSAWRTLPWILILMFVIIVIYWTSIAYLLNIFVISRTFLIILHKLDYKHTVQNCTYTYCKVRLYFLCGVSYIFTLLIVMHYVHIYRVIKNSKKGEDILNLCRVFCKRKARTYV